MSTHGFWYPRGPRTNPLEIQREACACILVSECFRTKQSKPLRTAATHSTGSGLPPPGLEGKCASPLGVQIRHLLLPPALSCQRLDPTARRPGAVADSLRPVFPAALAPDRNLSGPLFEHDRDNHSAGARWERRAFSDGGRSGNGCYGEKGGAPGLHAAPLLTQAGRQVSGAARPPGKVWCLKHWVFELRTQ